jgi:hypothetical protein
MAERGATEREILTTLASGEAVPAKAGRLTFRKNFPFEQSWKGRYYETKQVVPVVRDEVDRLVVITVYVFYFGGAR